MGVLMKKACIFLSIFLSAISASNLWAQETTDYQTRIILHEQADLSKNLFLVGWVIGNGQVYGTNNINLFGGFGYRGEKWWLESMVQRQWSAKDKKLLLDNRFQAQLAKNSSLYIEVAPFLDRKAVYDMVIFEQNVWHKLNLGAETENVHKPGKDSLGVGPRISAPLAVFGNYKLAVALAYQVRRQETNALRFYIVFNHKDKLY